MRLVHTTAAQDEILTEADNAGGIAADAADVCLGLDFQLSAALAEIQSLKTAFAAMCEQRDAATEALEKIAAQNAALRASLKWTINTLQGESGCGDSYWKQFHEYLTACALLADTQPEEETP